MIAPGGNPEAGPSQTFQVRDAVTTREGRRVTDLPGPGQTFQVREAVTLGDATDGNQAAPGQTFQVQEGGTVQVRPPHWDAVEKKEAEKQERELRTAGTEARPTIEGPQAGMPAPHKPKTARGFLKEDDHGRH